jgi:hypothetical protein
LLKMARPISLARDFGCDVENGVVIGYIVEAEAINRNPKLDAVVVPTLENPRVGQPHFFRFILPQKGRTIPLGAKMETLV